MGGVNQDISRVEGCAKGGNSVCLAGTCSEGQPKFKMFKKRIICRTR